VPGNEFSEVPVALGLRKKKFVSAVARRYEPVNGYSYFKGGSDRNGSRRIQTNER
jgi:hypothetical protein